MKNCKIALPSNIYRKMRTALYEKSLYAYGNDGSINLAINNGNFPGAAKPSLT